MFCPQCNASTLETAIQCHQCGSDLVGPKVASRSFLLVTRTLDFKRARSIGLFAGVVLFLALNQTLLQSLFFDRTGTLVGALTSGVVGAAIGHRIVSRHYKTYNLL